MDYSMEDFALFLADVTPPECKISGRSMSSALSFDDALRVDAAHCASKFENMLTLLPLFRRVHAQYKEKMRQLEEEVRRLRLTN